MTFADCSLSAADELKASFLGATGQSPFEMAFSPFLLLLSSHSIDLFWLGWGRREPLPHGVRQQLGAARGSQIGRGPPFYNS